MQNNNVCCCQSGQNCCDSLPQIQKKRWINGYNEVKGRSIPIVSTTLDTYDILGNIMVRWGISRSDYKITPGLYCVGKPDNASPVLVTANYKLTFDKLRKELDGLNAWILVLDTKGINVWCAAGKGTFGTEELIEKILAVKLNEIIFHKVIILPQLGAVGVQAHKVKEKTGFRVIYGPVRASDIKEFLKNNLKKTEKMKKVTFNLADRLAVIPVELVGSLKLMFLFLLLFVALNWNNISLKILYDFLPFLGAILTGCVAVPALLPWLPFRAFVLKGFVAGVLWWAIIGVIYKFSLVNMITFFFLLTPLTSFLSLNFTGATTYTSQSGTMIEVKKSMPFIIVFLIIGVVLKLLVEFKII